MRTVSFKKTRKVLDFVWNNKYSSFYKDKYLKVGINLVKDINSWDDFYKLPFLEKEELIQTKPKHRVLIEPKKIIRLSVSSGTSNSTRPLAMFRALNHPLQDRISLAKPKRLKIKTLLILYPSLSLHNSLSQLIRLNSNQNKGAVYINGDTTNLSLTAKIASEAEIDSIKTTPTALYNLLPFLKREYDISRIEYVCLDGEYCSEEKALFFKKAFKNALFDFFFVSIETALAGYKCKFLEKLPPRFLHTLPIFYYEVIDLKNKNELVITDLTNKRAFPLIRYKTGNSVAIVEQVCPCGETRVMEVFGRIGFDIAKIAGVTIYTELISKAISPFKDYLGSTTYQLHIFENIKGDKISYFLKLQLKKGPKQVDKDSLGEGISKGLYLSSKLTLDDFVRMGIFSSLEIEWISDFPLQGKHKNIIIHF